MNKERHTDAHHNTLQAKITFVHDPKIVNKRIISKLS